MSDPKNPAAPKVPGAPSWLALLGGAARVALKLPAVQEAIGTTLNGLERDPGLLAVVERFQQAKVGQQDCVVCLAYQTMLRRPPEHWCPSRENKELCGCGKPATRDGELPGMRRRVCEDFPGCVPVSKSSKVKRT